MKERPDYIAQVEAMRKLMEPLPLRVRLEDWRLEHGINNRAFSALMRIIDEEQEAA